MDWICENFDIFVFRFEFSRRGNGQIVVSFSIGDRNVKCVELDLIDFVLDLYKIMFCELNR